MVNAIKYWIDYIMRFSHGIFKTQSKYFLFANEFLQGTFYYLRRIAKCTCLHFLNQKVIIRRSSCVIPRPLELPCNFTVPWAKEFIDTPICHEIYTFAKWGNNFLFCLAWLLGDANGYWDYYSNWKLVDFGMKSIL